MVMATQNPIEQEGTYALPEAQLDRFSAACVQVDYPDRQAEADILRLGARRKYSTALSSRVPTAAGKPTLISQASARRGATGDSGPAHGRTRGAVPCGAGAGDAHAPGGSGAR